MRKIELENTKLSFAIIEKKKILIFKKKNLLQNLYFYLPKNINIKIISNFLYIDTKNNIYNQLIKIKDIFLNGIKKKILLLGLGYQCFYKNNNILFKLGYSHTVILKLPTNKISISIFKCRNKHINIIISDFLLHTVCNLNNQILNLKKSNAYKEIGFFKKNLKRKIKLFKKK